MSFNIDFVNRRKWWYALSLLVIIPGLIFMFINQPALNFGIDFTGGNIIQVQFEQPVSSSQVRDVLIEHNLGNSPIQAANENEFIIRTVEIDEVKTSQLISSLEEKLGQMDLKKNEKVGATIGRELTIKGIQAMIVAWVLMVIYITFRFEFLSGLAAIIALIHDVLVAAGLFAIFRWEVDTTFIAAILTIIGYSINNTIVIYDRIRENRRQRKRETIEDTVNRSINQNLTRTINTSLTVLFCLLALLFIGGETTRNFALAMSIGVIAGCYSSVCIAGTLWIDLRQMFRGNRKRAVTGKAKARRATSH